MKAQVFFLAQLAAHLSQSSWNGRHRVEPWFVLKVGHALSVTFEVLQPSSLCALLLAAIIELVELLAYTLLLRHRLLILRPQELLFVVPEVPLVGIARCEVGLLVHLSVTHHAVGWALHFVNQGKLLLCLEAQLGQGRRVVQVR